MIKKIALTIIVIISQFIAGKTSNAQSNVPTPFGPLPSENQLRWQEMEYYAFVHLSTNTFTDQEWGYGAPEDAKHFNPTELDADQWAKVCKDAGMKGIIITAKHHSGFCLWPTETTEYSVKNSPWKDGKGDIISDLAKACKKYGLKMGIYISPWDRNNASYGMLNPDGTAPYVTDVFRKQIEECLTNYGDIFEIWFDGANGGDGYYGGANSKRKIDRKTYYDWLNTYDLIRKLQPKAVIWNDNGDRADLRWVGTESGYVGETNWSLQNKTGDVTKSMLRYGVENGDAWVPGEVNTSTRPGWFYHKSEDGKVKKLPELVDIYYKSIGRNGTLLLNFPIDRRGLIPEEDVKATLAFAKAIETDFADNLATKAMVMATNIRGNNKKYSASNVIDGDENSFWATDDQVKMASLTIVFDKPKKFNRFMAQEYIRLGQRVKAFKLEALINGKWTVLKDQLVPDSVSSTTTIGYKRIISFPSVQASKLRFTITDSKACPLISNIGVYNAPIHLAAPLIRREKSGNILITSIVKGSKVYYTLDGSTPTSAAKKYNGEILTDGKKVDIKAIAFDSSVNRSGPMAEEKFDIAKKEWKVLGTKDPKAVEAIDGNINTVYSQGKNVKMPVDLVIDLGKVEELVGFKYLPATSANIGMITHYQYSLSVDNKTWIVVDEGEFSNIKNNPVWQIKTFSLENARYVKLTALKNTLENVPIGYAELDVMTR